MLVPIGWAAPAGRLALLRGVRAEGWMGKMPPSAWDWDCAALGRWRGVMEVSVVGMGSVSLRDKTWRHKFQVKFTNHRVLWSLWTNTSPWSAFGSSLRLLRLLGLAQEV